MDPEGPRRRAFRFSNVGTAASLLQLPAVERLVLAVAASGAVHAAALLVLASSPSGWDRSRLPSGPETERRAAFEVRLVEQLPEQAAVVALPGTSPGPLLPNAAQADATRAGGSAPASREQGQGIALIPPPKYYRVTELDVRPLIRTHVMPEYPPELQDVTGRVVIQVFIDEAGMVDDVTVSQAEPAGLFEASAIAAWRRARFTPGIKDQKAVKSRIVLEVTYGSPGQPDSATGAR